MKNLCKHGCGNVGIVKLSRSNEWRCSNSPHSCPAVKENKKRLLKEKYGVENVSQLKDVQSKREATIMDRYGVVNPWQMDSTKKLIRDKWPHSKEKRKSTFIEKYGVDSYSSTVEFKTRRKNTWIEKYGVDNPTKNKDILHKAMVSNGESEYRTKSFVFPSGKQVRYQGYENQVIEDLLKSGIHEDEIVTGPGNVPHIRYEFEGKICRYYPDIYIPKLNQLIEVKSLYTWSKYKKKNLAKYKAAKEAGFSINIVIKQGKKK